MIRGASYIPIKAGSKKPAQRWGEHRRMRAVPALVNQWLREGFWLGIVCGRVSCGLEVLDFDCAEVFQPWFEKASKLVEKPYIVQTPKGFHYYMRHADVGRSQVLAACEDGSVLIETRGEGSYVVALSSTNAEYRRWPGSAASFPPVVSEQCAERLMSLASAFDRRNPATPAAPGKSQSSGPANRVGDVFNRRMAWADLLTRYGWQHFEDLEGRRKLSHWTRPGKDSGISGTLGVGESGDLFHCFTSNAPPLEPGGTYDKFGFYAWVQHDGDFSAATLSLACQGYADNGGES